MCVCVWKPYGVRVTKDNMRKCFDNNPDGAGYMWAENGEVVIRKGFFVFKKFWAALCNDIGHINRQKSGIAIHFRISSSGTVDAQNCHPHPVNKQLAFIHNGILPLLVPPASKVSDSVIFASTILQDMPSKWYLKHNLKLLVELAIGTYNKIVFLDGEGKVTILHEDAGEWVEGVWYSNSHWKYSFRSTYNNGSFNTYTGAANNPWERNDDHSITPAHALTPVHTPKWGGYTARKDGTTDPVSPAEAANEAEALRKSVADFVHDDLTVPESAMSPSPEVASAAAAITAAARTAPITTLAAIIDKNSTPAPANVPAHILEKFQRQHRTVDHALPTKYAKT